MSKQKISKAKSINRTKTFVELIISAVLIAAAVMITKGALDRSSNVGSTSNVQETIPEETVIIEEETDPNKIIFASAPVKTKDKFYGDLILVNNSHQYFSTGEEDLVSILEMNDQTGRDFFTAVDYDYTILRPVYEPMGQMLEDFYKLYNNDTIIIYGSFRSTDFQQKLYEADLAENGSEDSTLVAKPGFSEHETGYAFDLSETENYDYMGTGDFAWINENCYKYGFVVRYTKAKENITEIRDEPWHFRYVGIPHAFYMTKNDLCLEEYIDLLREHPYDGEHLTFTDDQNKNYEVYFYASDDAAETTNVPVPTGRKYDISGNNVDGFIVTVYTDEIVEPGMEHTTEASTEASTETASEESSDAESDSEEVEVIPLT